MRLRDDQYESLKIEATELLVQCGIHSIPINPWEIAEKNELTLIPYSRLSPKKQDAAAKLSQDGFFWELNGRNLIFYEDRVSHQTRLRMTIMHEIAHFWLNHRGSPGKHDEEEAEAGFFARYALSPLPIVWKYQPEDSVCISDLFEISWEAGTYVYRNYLKWLPIFKHRGAMDYESLLLELFSSPSKELFFRTNNTTSPSPLLPSGQNFLNQSATSCGMLNQALVKLR